MRPQHILRFVVTTLVVSSLSLAFINQTAFANVDLLYFRAESSTDVITLVWETETELDNLGFNLWRGLTNNQSQAVRINASLIPSQVGGQPVGAYYEFVDSNVQEQITYWYWLESLDINGTTEFHEPAQAALSGGSAISTEPAGGGGPQPTTPPQPSRTPSPLPPGQTPTAPPPAQPSPTRPNPTPTSFTSESVATDIPTPANAGNPPAVTPTTNSGAANSPAPASQSTQPAPALFATDTQSELTTSALDAPLATATSASLIANSNSLPAAPTATFIAGDSIPSIGEQSPSAEITLADPTSPQEPMSGSQRVALTVLALLGGALLTASGAFALWFINKPGRRRGTPDNP